MKSYHFFIKDLFNTGMGRVEPAVRTVYGSPYRWGSEGGFGGGRTSGYQYVQGKKVFSRGGLRMRVPVASYQGPHTSTP